MTVHWLYWSLESDPDIDGLAFNPPAAADFVRFGSGQPFTDLPAQYWTGNGTAGSGGDGDRYLTLPRSEQVNKELFDSALWPNAGRFVIAFEYSAMGLDPPETSKQVVYCGDRNPLDNAQHGIGIVHSANDRLAAKVINGSANSVSIAVPSNSTTRPTITDWHREKGRMGVFLDIDFASGTLAIHAYTLGANPLKQSTLPRKLDRIQSLSPPDYPPNVAQLAVGHLPSANPSAPGSAHLHSSLRRLHVINFGHEQADRTQDGNGIPDNLSELFARIAADEMILNQEHLNLAGLNAAITKKPAVAVRRYRIRTKYPIESGRE